MLLVYFELIISFLIGRKRNLDADHTIIMSRTLKVTANHVVYDRGPWFLWVIMSSSLALSCLPSVKKQKHDFFCFVQCTIKQIRLITTTSTLIILDITKTSSSNCLLLCNNKEDAFKEELCKFSFAVTLKFFRSTILSTEFIYLHSYIPCTTCSILSKKKFIRHFKMYSARSIFRVNFPLEPRRR